MTLQKITTLGEKLFLLVLLIGVLLFLTNYESRPVVYSALIGLSIIYFINAFTLLPIKPSEDEQMGFSELFAWLILPKVLWIGTSVVTVGILFYFMDLGNDGYQKMLTIGCSTLITALFLLVVMALTGVKQLTVLIPILYRVISVLLAGGYILYAYTELF